MDHSVVLTLILGTLLFIVISVTVVMLVINSQQRHISYLLEQSATKHSYETQLLQSRLETQEQSFQYFSEEIHDNVGQLLSVVGMYLYQLEIECTDDSTRELSAKGSELLNKAIKDLRSISHTFNAHYIGSETLEECLAQEVGYINSVKESRCKLIIDGEPKQVKPEHQILLFRILQEAIANALKHSDASLIVVTIEFQPQLLIASVKDNGKGVAPTEGTSSKGLGRINMELRANLLASTLEFESEVGVGTEVKLNYYFQ